MQDPDEAMENFPFELEGDGDKKKREGIWGVDIILG